jgi:energy-coupling factor transport system substrate-specific component
MGAALAGTIEGLMREPTVMLGAHAITAPPLLLALLDATVLIGALLAVFSIERRLPKARAVLTLTALVVALAASRVLFATLPNIQFVTVAMLLIGVHLGARRGFAVGVGVAYASNLFLGFGLFAPFQALGWGLCAVAAYHARAWLLDEAGEIRVARLAASGFIAAFAFDIFVSMYAFAGIGSLPAFMTYLLLGLPYDLLHAAGNVVIAAWAGNWLNIQLRTRILPELNSTEFDDSVAIGAPNVNITEVVV